MFCGYVSKSRLVSIVSQPIKVVRVLVLVTFDIVVAVVVVVGPRNLNLKFGQNRFSNS